jgi:hypothetical protein
MRHRVGLAAVVAAGCAASVGGAEPRDAGVRDAASGVDTREDAPCVGGLRAEGRYCVGWRVAAGPSHCAVWGGWNLVRVAGGGSLANECTGEPLQVYDPLRDAWTRAESEVAVVQIERVTALPPVPPGVGLETAAMLPDGTLVGSMSAPSARDATLQTWWVAPPGARAWERTVDPPAHAIVGSGAALSGTEVLFLGNAGVGPELSSYVYVRSPR